MKIQVSCPAKINLTLEVINKREDGFHNIKSIMQTINLYDYLTIEAEEAESTNILLSGNSSEIPYNEKNLVYRACKLFLDTTGMNADIKIHIEKNIPVSAGLAGGSTDAAGTLAGLNELFSRPLNNTSIHTLCAALGSDLNVCLEGGCILAEGRGEKITKIKTDMNYPLVLVKPKNLGISAKEAYTKYSCLKNKPALNMTEKMLEAINSGSDIRKYLYNDLETAVFNDYEELQEIKKQLPESVMSGSGSTYFILNDNPCLNFDDSYLVFKRLHFTPYGIKCNNFVTN